MDIFKPFAIRIILVLILCGGSGVSAAQSQDAGKGVPVRLSYEELGKQLDQLIELQKADVDRYAAMLKRNTAITSERSTAINSYKIQVSTYSSLVAVPDIADRDLNGARNEILRSLSELEKLLTTTIDRFTEIQASLTGVQEQVADRKARLAELKKSPEKDLQVQKLVPKLQDLLNVLSVKQELLDKLKPLFENWIDQFKRIQQAFLELSGQFEKRIRDREKMDLFQRTADPFSRFNVSMALAEIQRLRDTVMPMVSADFWKSELTGMWYSVGYSLITYGLLLIVTIYLLVRSRAYLIGLREQPFFVEHKAHRIALTLAGRSIVLAGLALFFELSTLVDALYYSTPSLSVMVRLLVLWLMTRWGLDLVSLIEVPSLPAPARTYLTALLRLIRYAGSLGIVIRWMLGGVGVFISSGRLFFGVGLLVWVALFWKTVPRSALPDRYRFLRPALMGVSYGIVAIGLLLELTGYTPFMLHWYFSWVRTAAVGLWWALFAGLLMEWDTRYRQKAAAGADAPAAYPIQWLIIRSGQLLWIISLGIALVFAWGGERTVLVNIYRALAHPISIGNMSFSVLGVCYAILVLLATQAVGRLWRQFFSSKFLNRSGMEPGLQESVATLSVYLLWAFGILIALHVFGLNTATLAVAFGAIGIGLGFGLQNIFSNFVSGIILLFERPIQVGDDVEVNGIWATVKKINVRATVVQTYDNASLIIPNSEFITTQVTNWSFKDKRVRRNIDVGVAYGSNIELVRDTMLEVVAKSPKVLKHPKPEVLFSDFGDSALIFRLRVWMLIDNMLRLESEIRFSIDRLFRERGIEIAFPQRDIHIRSTVGSKEADLVPEATDVSEEAIDPQKKG